jgi:hypothetical protein
MLFERTVSVANASNADRNQEHECGTQAHIDVNDGADHGAERTVLRNHTDGHFHDTADNGLNDEKVADDCVYGGKQKAEKHLLSKSQALPKTIHPKILLEEPGRYVEGQAARKPYPESAVNPRSNMLVGAMGLFPSLEFEDLSFQGLLSQLLLKLFPLRRFLFLIRMVGWGSLAFLWSSLSDGSGQDPATHVTT